jgi:hypothetical protein
MKKKKKIIVNIIEPLKNNSSDFVAAAPNNENCSSTACPVLRENRSLAGTMEFFKSFRERMSIGFKS